MGLGRSWIVRCVPNSEVSRYSVSRGVATLRQSGASGGDGKDEPRRRLAWLLRQKDSPYVIRDGDRFGVLFISVN